MEKKNHQAKDSSNRFYLALEKSYFHTKCAKLLHIVFKAYSSPLLSLTPIHFHSDFKSDVLKCRNYVRAMSLSLTQNAGNEALSNSDWKYATIRYLMPVRT